MRVLDMVQMSPEWYEARMGIPTASEFDRIITPKGKLSGGVDAFIEQLLGERECGHPGAMTEKVMNPAMRHGIECEPQARAAYAVLRGVEVRMVGFCVADCGRYGSSPDGLIDPEGAVEIKCPVRETHERYLRRGGLPPEYRPQVHGHLIVTGRSWCDFFSFHEEIEPHLVRVVPDEYTRALRVCLEQFLGRYAKAIHNKGKP